jgi:hypothetical protein
MTAMTEILVKIPDHQVSFFIALLQRLQFAEVEHVNGQKISKEIFLSQFEESVREANLHLQGKTQLRSLQEVLNEL